MQRKTSQETTPAEDPETRSRHPNDPGLAEAPWAPRTNALARFEAQSVFEAIPAPALLVDTQGLITAANKDACNLTGETPRTLTGRRAESLVVLEDEQAWQRIRNHPAGSRGLNGHLRAPTAVLPVRVDLKAISTTGHLVVTLRSASRDEAMIRSLREIAERTAHTAAGLTSMGKATTRKTEQIRSSMQGIADGTQVQARKIEETVEVIKDLAKSIDQISNHAVSASGRIQAQAVTAREGTEVANQAFDRLSKIIDDVQTTAKSVHDLAAHVEQVEKILDFVDEIARETNLVSLNAAIEAARAGPHGRAFGAVADEVKRLAAHTRESLTDTASLIHAAKGEAGMVQRNTDARVQEVMQSAQGIREALTRFESVASDILESSEIIGSISEATVQQKRGAGAIVAAIDEVAGVAEEATKGTEEAHIMAEEVANSMQALTQASHELTEIATSLRATLDRCFQSSMQENTGVSTVPTGRTDAT